MKCRKGMTLIEVTIAMAVLAIGAMGLAAAFLSASDLENNLREERIVNTEIMAKVSEIQSKGRMDSGDETYLNSLLSFYNNAENTTFDIDGLHPPQGQNAVGQIFMHLNENMIPAELGADVDTLYEVDGRLYGEMDVDGDTASKNDYSSLAGDTMDDIMLAPLEIRVTWMTRNGPLTIRRFVAVARYDAAD